MTFDDLYNRVTSHWKTTLGGVLSVAGVVFSVMQKNNPDQKWVLEATAIVAGLTGILGKDK